MTDLHQQLDGLKIERKEDDGGGGWPRWLGFLVVALVLVGAVAWWWFRPQAIEVQVATAREIRSGGQQTILNASGYVTARRQATVSSKVTGKVIEVLIEEGMEVVEGQVLARLDLSNTEVSRRLALAQWNASKAALGETRALLNEAELNLDRAAELVKNQIASQAELDRAMAARDSLAARLARQADEVEVADRQVGLWRQEVADREIRAPFDGVVVSKNAQPGEMISPVSAGGGFTRTGICTIVDMSSLEIEIDVNEAYINRVAAGQPVEAILDAYPDWTIAARVIAIVPTADRQRATVRVRVGFEELDPRVLPDMGVKVAFQRTESRAESDAEPVTRVAIPAAAVVESGESQVVWVTSAGRVERRAVTVDVIGDDEALLSAGLRAGERVVVSPPETLSEEDQVEESAS